MRRYLALVLPTMFRIFLLIFGRVDEGADDAGDVDDTDEMDEMDEMDSGIKFL